MRICPPDSLYPVVIIEDRYQGSYSHGAWLAIANADLPHSGQPRLVWILENGPSGDDLDAAEFWAYPPGWIAVGSTPDTAALAIMHEGAASTVEP